MEFSHVTVLLKETVDSLNLKPNGIYVDGTLGGGGHSEYLLSQLGEGGKLIGIDQDQDAHKAAGERLARFGNKFVPVHSNFVNIKNVVDDLGIAGIDGMLMDLGVSSYQLDEAERGFSYMNDGALDMRMNKDSELTAWHIANEYTEKPYMNSFEIMEKKNGLLELPSSSWKPEEMAKLKLLLSWSTSLKLQYQQGRDKMAHIQLKEPSKPLELKSIMN